MIGKRMNKLTKYRVLRRLPGVLGHRYERKYAVRTNGFDNAVHRSEGMTCIDLGANVGAFTKTMASRASQVIAFEPDPWTYQILRENVADLKNVRLENAAAGTRDGVALLFRHARFDEDPIFYSEASSIISSHGDVTEDESFEVRQIDFISYLEVLDENIGVLKIDIEGAEVELLEALFDRPELLERIDHIFAETHERLIPGHKSRVKALRALARKLEQPYINLYWH